MAHAAMSPFSEKIYLHRQGSSTYFAGEVYLLLDISSTYTQQRVKVLVTSSLFSPNSCTTQIKVRNFAPPEPPSLLTMLNRRQTESNVKLV